MSIEKLKELGQQLLELSNNSNVCADLIEQSLENLLNYFSEPNDDQSNDFNNIPPQIRSTNGSDQAFNNQSLISGPQQIYYQDLLIPGSGNQNNFIVNSNIQTQQIPFLFHNLD